MNLRSDLFEMARRYLRGEADIAALADFLDEHAQDIGRLDSSDSAAQLAGLIEVTLAEIDDQVATESDLSQRVSAFVEAQPRASR